MKIMTRSAFKQLIFMLGIFATMPIVTIEITGRYISVFSLLFFLALVVIIFVSFVGVINIKINIELILFSSFLLLSLVASFVGIAYFVGDAEWQIKAASYIPKILVYLVFLFCITRIVLNDLSIATFFFNGLLLGCVANCLWAILEGLTFYFAGFSLNDSFFVGYATLMPVDRPYITIITDGMIRASGFNYDPAHLGGIAPIVFLYALFRRSFSLLAVSILAMVFSASTTAIVVSLLGLIFSPPKLYKDYVGVKFIYILMLVIIAIVPLVSFEVLGSFFDAVSNNLLSFFDRINSVYIDNLISGPRYVYHAYIIHAVAYNGLLVLTGTGFGTSSFPFVDSPYISKVLDHPHMPYDPESTYISYLFATGIFGLLCYLFVLVRLLIKFRVKAVQSQRFLLVYSALISVFFAGFFYHYTLTAYQVLILIFSIALICRNNILQSRISQSIRPKL